MRPLSDLAAELNDWGRRLEWAAALLVSKGENELLEYETSGAADLLQGLEALIRDGWHPAALIGFWRVEGCPESWVFSFKALAEDKEAHDLSERISDSLLKICAKKGWPGHMVSPKNN